MKTIFTCLVVSIFCVGMSCSAQCLAQSNNTTDTYKVGGQSTSEQNYKAAQAVSDGLSLLNSGQMDLALQKFQYAVQLAPSMSEAHHNLGYALTKLGRTTEAIDEYKKAIALQDNTESVWLSLGGLYQSTGHIDLAIQTLQEFLKRFPSSVQYHKIASLVEGLKQEYHQQLAEGGYPTSSSVESTDYFTAATAIGAARWPASLMPLTVHIADGRSVPFYHPEYAIILKTAFLDWSSASRGLISFVFVDDSSQAVINCSWTNDPSTLNNSAEAGEAAIVKANGYISRATIRILTVPLTPELPVTPNRLAASCLHEIGHVLGIQGHSSDPADIMFSSAELSDNPRSLSSRDRNTLLRLYSMGSR